MSKIILPAISLVFFSFFINQILIAKYSYSPHTFLAIAKDKGGVSDDKSLDKDTPANLRRQGVSDPNSFSNQRRTQNTPDDSIANPPFPATEDTGKSKRIEALIQKTGQTLQTPQITAPSDGEKVEGVVRIEILAPESYSVDLSLQTAAGPAKAFYLGVGGAHDSGRLVFNWDTNNTPNWSYTLIAKANFNFHQSLFAKNINVIVDNPIPESPKDKGLRDQTLKKLGLPTYDQISKASKTTELVESNEPAKAETESSKGTTTPSTSPSPKTTPKSETTPSLSPTPGGKPTGGGLTSPQASPSAGPASQSSPSPSPSVSTPTSAPSPSPSPLANISLPETTNVEAVVNPSSELGFSPAKIVVVKEVAVEKIENIASKENKTALILRGKALPNSIVTIYILSDPIVVTVRADANGNWTYVLDKPLVAGEHETFVTVAKPDGSLVRSEVTTFSIAKAAGGNQEEGLVLVAESGNKFQVFITYTAGLIVLAVAVLLVIFFFRKPAVVEDVVD